jgi:hypothetical protein
MKKRDWHGLLYCPVYDSNFISYLKNAETEDLRAFLADLQRRQSIGGGHLTRIKAVSRELRRRMDAQDELKEVQNDARRD